MLIHHQRSIGAALALGSLALAAPAAAHHPGGGGNTGGTVIYLSPGVRVSVDKWSSYVSLGIPVVNESNGIQPEPSWRIITGVSLAF